jgi:hypothetical protein
METSTEQEIINEQSIVIGCNYHTKWQKHKGMRFVLAEVKGDKARMYTRNTVKNFWTNVSDLIFIMSPHNIAKAKHKIKSNRNS